MFRESRRHIMGKIGFFSLLFLYQLIEQVDVNLYCWFPTLQSKVAFARYNLEELGEVVSACYKPVLDIVRLNAIKHITSSLLGLGSTTDGHRYKPGGDKPFFRVQSFFHDDPTNYSGYTRAAKPDWIEKLWAVMAILNM